MLSKNIFSFPKGPPVPELQRGKVWWFRENAFGKNVVTFHLLSRFSWNIVYFKGNKFGDSKIILGLENTVFPRNDVITKLKKLITCLGTPTNFGAKWHNLGTYGHYWISGNFFTFWEKNKTLNFLHGISKIFTRVNSILNKNCVFWPRGSNP